MKHLYIFLVTVNALGFLFMLADKGSARKKAWRIPEATLLLFAAIGGSLGTLLAMHLFHHKTRKLKFSLGVPVLFAVHCLLFVYFFAKRCCLKMYM